MPVPNFFTFSLRALFCQNTRRRPTMAKEAVENPGAADTPVDLDKLKSALACPLCKDMYRFPVTVVRASSSDPLSRLSHPLSLSLPHSRDPFINLFSFLFPHPPPPLSTPTLSPQHPSLNTSLPQPLSRARARARGVCVGRQRHVFLPPPVTHAHTPSILMRKTRCPL